MKADELQRSPFFSFVLRLCGSSAPAELCVRRVKTDELCLRVVSHPLLASLGLPRTAFNVVDLHYPFRKGS